MVSTFKYYMLHTVNLTHKIMQVNAAPRQHLVTVPKVIQYEEVVDHDFVQVFMNVLHSYIAIEFVGDFASEEEAIALYNNDTTFDETYNHSVEVFQEEVEHITDFDETFYVIIEENEAFEEMDIDVHHDHIKIRTPYATADEFYNDAAFYHEKVVYSSVLDMLFIHLACKKTDDFLKELSSLHSLNRKNQYLISYYSTELFKLKDPDFYLTNAYDIEVAKQFYEQWKLKEDISLVQEVFNQSVANYSFLWDYNNQMRQKSMNLYLLVLTLMAAYSPVLQMMETIVKPDLYPIFEKVGTMLFIFIIVIVLLSIVLRFYIPSLLQKLRDVREKNYFKRKSE